MNEQDERQGSVSRITTSTEFIEIGFENGLDPGAFTIDTTGNPWRIARRDHGLFYLGDPSVAGANGTTVTTRISPAVTGDRIPTPARAVRVPLSPPKV